MEGEAGHRSMEMPINVARVTRLLRTGALVERLQLAADGALFVGANVLFAPGLSTRSR